MSCYLEASTIVGYRWFSHAEILAREIDETFLPQGLGGLLGDVINDAQHGVGVYPERAEYLPPRPERRRTLDLDAATPRRGGVPGQGNPGKLLGEPGLVDTRLADAQDEPACTGPRVGPPTQPSISRWRGSRKRPPVKPRLVRGSRHDARGRSPEDKEVSGSVPHGAPACRSASARHEVMNNAMVRTLNCARRGVQPAGSTQIRPRPTSATRHDRATRGRFG